MRPSPTLLLALGGLVAGAALVALLPERAIFASSPEHAAAAAGPTGERWACPMMDFIGSRPGDCPVCGMEMTRVTAGELTREQRRRMGMELTAVTAGPARATVRAYGRVRYDDRALRVVIPRVSGRIVYRHEAVRHSGNFVPEGGPLVDLYSPEVFAAQAELAAALKLGDAPTVRAVRDRFARWNLAPVAEAVLAGNPPTDTITVTSPFAGRLVVAFDNQAGAGAVALPQVGQEVGADTPLVQLVDPEALIVTLNVPETRAHWLREGQPVRLASDDRGELPEVQAAVAWLAPEFDPLLRTREVHLHLRDPGQRLLPGSLVHARIEAVLGADLAAADPADPATWGEHTLVPKTAILSTGVRHVAWRVAARDADGRLRFELAPVALGPRLEDEAGNDLYVVRAGLAPGDEVAAQGAFLVDSQAQLAGTPSLLFPLGATAPAPAHQH
jgi:Cu(I)/Ag(I) efflux system membrane fusion protein